MRVPRGNRTKVLHALSTHLAAADGYTYPGFVPSGWMNTTDRADGRKLLIDPAAMPTPHDQFLSVAYATSFGSNGGPVSWNGIAGPAIGTSPSSSPTTTNPGGAGGVAAFAGLWVGHTRSLTITSSGRGTESISEGCGEKLIKLTFRLSKPKSTGSTSTATVTVVSSHPYPGWTDEERPAPKPGDTGTISLHDEVIKESITHTNYCNNSADLTGTCGA
jgi:hypothetical protein